MTTTATATNNNQSADLNLIATTTYTAIQPINAAIYALTHAIHTLTRVHPNIITRWAIQHNPNSTAPADNITVTLNLTTPNYALADDITDELATHAGPAAIAGSTTIHPT